MTKEELIDFLRQNLSIELDSSTVYTGCSDGPLYETRLVVRLMLESEVISEVTA